MANDIEDIIAAFEAKMKQAAKVEAPAEAAVAEPSGEEQACVNKNFKELVGVLPSLYIGFNLKEMLKEVLETYPECEV